ncbi:MAG: TonB-dependent receptor [Acidobacteria bacterium]|nr:TonB-dependent receptor [Acidobacteriota bacterium]
MKVRFTAFLTVLAIFAGVSVGAAQVQSGDITGRVADNTGAVLPGVTVTATSPALITPLTAVTSSTGTYQFPRVPIGTYTVRFELPGFSTLVREGVVVTIGFNATINADLQLSSVQETVTVSGSSPVVDTRNTTQKTTFDLEAMQSIPSARDPWVMLERTPAIAMDRINVGGSQSGQQSGYVSRGSGTGNNKWSLDGVDITDMSATGASPLYYDFDMLQEMQVVTGGADASQQTGGVGINFVSRSGTNAFRGSARLYNTNERFQGDNVTDELRAQGAGSGNPIQNINDYGFEVGGPIKRDKLWYWGSYSKQAIDVGVNGFWLPTPTCRPAGVPTNQIANTLGSTDAIRDCLATDGTKLDNYNWKLTWAPVQNNKFNFQNTWGSKSRNARDASDTRPLETAYRQSSVGKEFGQFGWITGPSPIWKASDQHVFSDRWLGEVQYGHVGNNFTLTFQEPAQRDIQATFDIPTGVWGRSFQESVFLRPTDSVDVTTSYFLPATLGGDHAFKAGYRWRTARAESINHRGGFADARFTNGVATEADMWRDGYTNFRLKTNAIYVQDTFTRSRFTVNLGLRWDHQTDEALASVVPANPLIPNILPAIDFPGVESPISYSDISPRIGVNYDIFGSGRTVARTSYSTYYGQLNTGGLSGNLVAIGAVQVRYPWNDANGDKFVQPNELTFVANPVKSATLNLSNPTNFASPGRLNSDLKNDRTREFIVGMDHELMPGVGLGASYIWRKYDQFSFTNRDNWSSANFAERSATPPNCGAQAICGPITYFVATSAQPTPYQISNIPDRHRDYNGLEVTLDKRYANRWMANASFAYNDAKDYFDSPASYVDPTNVANLNGYEFAPESGGSGIDSVFTSAKWLFKASGMYTTPLWNINVAANTQYRQGYPHPAAIDVTNRGNGLGTARVIIEPLGDRRLENTFILDFRVDRAFHVNRFRFVPSIDFFNATNANTEQSRRRVMASYNHGTGAWSYPANANNISSIIAPRIIRFGVRMTW